MVCELPHFLRFRQIGSTKKILLIRVVISVAYHGRNEFGLAPDEHIEVTCHCHCCLEGCDWTKLAYCTQERDEADCEEDCHGSHHELFPLLAQIVGNILQSRCKDSSE